MLTPPRLRAAQSAPSPGSGNSPRGGSRHTPTSPRKSATRSPLRGSPRASALSAGPGLHGPPPPPPRRRSSHRQPRKSPGSSRLSPAGQSLRPHGAPATRTHSGGYRRRRSAQSPPTAPVPAWDDSTGVAAPAPALAGGQLNLFAPTVVATPSDEDLWGDEDPMCVRPLGVGAVDPSAQESTWSRRELLAVCGALALTQRGTAHVNMQGQCHDEDLAAADGRYSPTKLRDLMRDMSGGKAVRDADVAHLLRLLGVSRLASRSLRGSASASARAACPRAGEQDTLTTNEEAMAGYIGVARAHGGHFGGHRQTLLGLIASARRQRAQQALGESAAVQGTPIVVGPGPAPRSPRAGVTAVSLTGHPSPCDAPGCCCVQFRRLCASSWQNPRAPAASLAMTDCGGCGHSCRRHGFTEEAVLVPQDRARKKGVCSVLEGPSEAPGNCMKCPCRVFVRCGSSRRLCHSCLHTLADHNVAVDYATLFPEAAYDAKDIWTLSLHGDVRGIGLRLQEAGECAYYMLRTTALAGREPVYRAGWGVTIEGKLQLNRGCLFEPPQPQQRGLPATPLHLAVAAGHLSAAKLLMLHGADPAAVTPPQAKTPHELPPWYPGSCADVARACIRGDRLVEMLKVLRARPGAQWDWETPEELYAAALGWFDLTVAATAAYPVWRPPFHSGDVLARYPRLERFAEPFHAATVGPRRGLPVKVKAGQSDHWLYLSLPKPVLLAGARELLGSGGFNLELRGCQEEDVCCGGYISCAEAAQAELAADAGTAHCRALSSDVSLEGARLHMDAAMAKAGHRWGPGSRVGVDPRKHPALCDYRGCTPPRRVRPCFRLLLLPLNAAGERGVVCSFFF
eukprot:TRINITY_DN77_c0_g3_i1.p1 TRINITY_DN77_c0_g3~~TRINITY_DN77_c0_g3_i1.p1  ORF type:complete len:851 (+),score=130.55 TRINITY_DN77_c0_g3_i1:82-2634(+)